MTENSRKNLLKCGGCGKCAVCRLAAGDPRYHQLVYNGHATVPLPRVPCLHEGAVLEFCTGCGNKEGRHVRDCDLYEKCTRDRVSTLVRSCLDCPDYSPDPDAAPPGYVKVPAPPEPEFRQKPTSDRGIVTFVSGKNAQEVFDISMPLMIHYATMVHADFHVCWWDGGVPEYPVATKFALTNYLGHYRRLLVVDADVLFPLGSPDLFARVGTSQVGAFDELPGFLKMPEKGMGYVKEYQEARRRWGLPAVAFSHSANVGLMVLSSEHLPVMQPPKLLAKPVVWCAEQHWWNARIHDAGVGFAPLNDVSRVWCVNGGFEPSEVGKILHFAGTPNHKTRVREMKHWSMEMRKISPVR